MKNFLQASLTFVLFLTFIVSLSAQTKKPVFSKETYTPQTFVQSSTRCNPNAIVLTASATSFCKKSSTVTYYYQIDYQNDGKVDVSGVGNKAILKDHINYTFGTHSVRWVAVDGCGGLTSAIKLIKVENSITHQPKVITKLLSIELMPSLCMAILEATKINNFSSDSCSNSKLQFRVVKKDAVKLASLTSAKDVLALSDKVIFQESECGVQTVYFFAVNDIGGWSYVETYIFVMSNLDPNCCMREYGNISGKITNSKGEAILDTNTIVYLDKYISIWQTDKLIVNKYGQFGSPPILSTTQFQSVTFTPSSTSKFKEELAPSNVSLLKDIISGKLTVNNPYARIAADVNKDGVLDDKDVDKLTNILDPTKPDDYSTYRFISKKYQFYTTKPEAEKFNESITINYLSPFYGSVDFVAVKLGDIAYNMLWNAEERQQVSNSNRIDFQPNPFKGQTKAVLNLTEAQPIKVELFDNNGKQCLTKEQFVKEGQNEILFDEKEFPRPGIYFCKVTLQNQVLIQKVIRL